MISLTNSIATHPLSSKPLEIGDVAPDFELVSSDGEKHKLSSYRGKRVLLSFFRYAAWPVCLYAVDRMKQRK